MKCRVQSFLQPSLENSICWLESAHPPLASLDAFGLQAIRRLFGVVAGDGDVAAGGEDVDLADGAGGKAGVAGGGVEDIVARR